MAQETFFRLFIKALQQIVTDIMAFLPKIVLAIVVLTITILIIKLMNLIFGKILKLINLEEIFKKIVKIQLPFSLNNFIIILIDIGIMFIALFGIASLFLNPQQMELVKEIIRYGARIISVIAITILTFTMFSALIERMSVETRMRGYIIFILLILVTIMVIDLTALSESTKIALLGGLSIGLGIAIGVFAIWFFFHDYFDKLLLIKKTSIEKSKNESKET